MEARPSSFRESSSSPRGSPRDSPKNSPRSSATSLAVRPSSYRESSASPRGSPRDSPINLPRSSFMSMAVRPSAYRESSSSPRGSPRDSPINSPRSSFMSMALRPSSYRESSSSPRGSPRDSPINSPRTSFMSMAVRPSAYRESSSSPRGSPRDSPLNSPRSSITGMAARPPSYGESSSSPRGSPRDLPINSPRSSVTGMQAAGPSSYRESSSSPKGAPRDSPINSPRNSFKSMVARLLSYRESSPKGSPRDSPINSPRSSVTGMPAVGPSSYRESSSSPKGSPRDSPKNSPRRGSRHGESANGGKPIKVIVLGMKEVGKTALISQFLYNQLPKKYKATIDDTHIATFRTGKDQKLVFEILDTSGALEFPAMLEVSIQQYDVFVLVYDASESSTFKKLEELREQIVRTKGKPPVVVVANKIDQCEEKDLEEVETHRQLVTEEWENGFVDASAKENTNTWNVFQELLTQANIEYDLEPALHKRRQSLPPQRPSIAQMTLSPAQLQHLEQIRENSDRRSDKGRNSCSVS